MFIILDHARINLDLYRYIIFTLKALTCVLYNYQRISPADDGRKFKLIYQLIKCLVLNKY